MSLQIDLRSGNDTAFAHYANFNVSSEANHYEIELSGYFGTAGKRKYNTLCEKKKSFCIKKDNLMH